MRPLFKHICRWLTLLVGLVGYWLQAVCASETSSLPQTLVKIKPGIVVVGSLMATRNPRAQFLATGFAVADGSLIVTNAHVIPKLDTKHLEQLAVFYKDKQEDKFILAKLHTVDKVHDLALLQLEGKNRLPPLKLGDAAHVQEGQLYAFTGYPIGMILGLYPVTHRGIIAAISPNAIPMIGDRNLNPRLLKSLNHPFDIFQLDATAYPGNSGSPLYEIETGAVIGIVNKVFVQESKENALSKPSGISYAIPANHIENLLREQLGKPTPKAIPKKL